MDSKTHDTPENAEHKKVIPNSSQATSSKCAGEKCESGNLNEDNEINPNLLKILSPDGSEFIKMEYLRNMIKTALGVRFTDDEINSALQDLGFPLNEPIHYRVFMDLVSAPLPNIIGQVDENFGEWLSIEDWQAAMARVGIELSKEEVEKAVSHTKQKLLSNFRKENADAQQIKSAQGDLPKEQAIPAEPNKLLTNADDIDDEDDVFLDVSDEFICSE